MNNLELYEKVRRVPKEAQKAIGAGRLKGMTDINPMWRIKTLTEHFGMCGIGWKVAVVKEWIEVGANGEQVANVMINLFVKVNGEWSDGIVGIGGSKLVAKENAGLYTDDECFKKAYTDAISVACKALGIGADVYWDKDTTKYSEQEKQATVEFKAPTKEQIAELEELGGDMERVAVYYKKTMSELDYEEVQAIINRKKNQLKENKND